VGLRRGVSTTIICVLTNVYVFRPEPMVTNKNVYVITIGKARMEHPCAIDLTSI